MDQSPHLAQVVIGMPRGGEALNVPGATTPDAWLNDEGFQGGCWMLTGIDKSSTNTRTIRINVSLPENLVPLSDAAAEARGRSHSVFLAAAAKREMAFT